MNLPCPTSEQGLTAVIAMTSNGVIGHEGGMPWKLRTDLRRFKNMTMGGTLIMGRRTYDSIGRPLPGRKTIVITRDDSWSAEGVVRARSPMDAVAMARGTCGYVVGGAEIYRQLLPHCQYLNLTRVLARVEGDTTVEIELSEFTITERTRIPASDTDQYPTEFLKMVRSSVLASVQRP